MRTAGSHQIQGPDDSAAMGRTIDQAFQDVQVQEGASSISEPMSLKPGIRKRLLGDLQKAIDAIENKVETSCEHLESLDSKDLQDIMHLRLVGEVFSPDRFTSSAGRFDLQPGRAFDLQLGDQLLCPKQRKACLEHIRQKKYGLVVVTPPCEMFSLLQYLGLGRSKASCQADPQFQEKMRRAKVLLNFAALICHVQDSWEVASFLSSRGMHFRGKNLASDACCNVQNTYLSELTNACLDSQIAMVNILGRERVL